jgi:hypothetical protein
MWPFKKRPEQKPADPYGPHIVGPFGKRWRIEKQIRGNGKTVYVVQRVYNDGKWSALPESTFDTMEEAEAQLNWWINSDKAIEVLQADTVLPRTEAEP